MLWARWLGIEGASDGSPGFATWPGEGLSRVIARVETSAMTARRRAACMEIVGYRFEGAGTLLGA